MSAESSGSLRAEVERLRQQVRAQEEKISELRRREEGVRALISTLADAVFEVGPIAEAAAAPRVRFVGTTEQQIRDEQLAHVVRSEQFREHEQQAAESGSPVSFSWLGEDRLNWQVSMVALPSGEEGGVRMLASACQDPWGAVDGVRIDEKTCRQVIQHSAEALFFFDEGGGLRYANDAALGLLGADELDDAREATLVSTFPGLVEEGTPTPSSSDEVATRFNRLSGDSAELGARLFRIREEQKSATLVAVRPPDYSWAHLDRSGALGRDALRSLGPANAVEAAEEEVEAAEEGVGSFGQVMKLCPSPLMVLDEEDGHVVEANAALCEALEYDRATLVGRYADEVGLWDEEREYRDLLRALDEEEVVRERILTLRSSGGNIRILMVAVRRLVLSGRRCLLFSGFDVTGQHREAPRELRNRELLRRFFHASPAAIIITRRADGEVIDVNRAFCRIVGYDRAQLLGETTLKNRLWDDPGKRIELVRAVMQQDEVHDFEIDVRTRGGEKRTILFSIQHVLIDDDPCIISVGSDITLRKHSEQALREAKEQAEEMARFQAGVLTNLTHEVRTPLTVILGFTSMLQRGVREEYRRFVHLIERSGRRLLLMLDSVLDLAQLEAGTLEISPVDLNLLDLVHNLVEEHSSLASERGLDLELLPAPASNVYVRADYDVLGRVISHILDNAIKFTRNGRVAVGLRLEDDQVMLDIQDTGIGISDAFLSEIFTPFAQESTGLERTHQGSGLGLTVARRLLEQQGGGLSVQSTKGEGSVFTLTLPLVSPSS